MNTRTINRLSADSIRDINDVKTWARHHETRMDNRVDEVCSEISRLIDRDDKLQKMISRSVRLWMITTMALATVLGFVVFLGGAIYIISAVKALF